MEERLRQHHNFNKLAMTTKSSHLPNVKFSLNLDSQSQFSSQFNRFSSNKKQMSEARSSLPNKQNNTESETNLHLQSNFQRVSAKNRYSTLNSIDEGSKVKKKYRTSVNSRSFSNNIYFPHNQTHIDSAEPKILPQKTPQSIIQELKRNQKRQTQVLKSNSKNRLIDRVRKLQTEQIPRVPKNRRESATSKATEGIEAEEDTSTVNKMFERKIEQINDIYRPNHQKKKAKKSYSVYGYATKSIRNSLGTADNYRLPFSKTVNTRNTAISQCNTLNDHKTSSNQSGKKSIQNREEVNLKGEKPTTTVFDREEKDPEGVGSTHIFARLNDYQTQTTPTLGRDAKQLVYQSVADSHEKRQKINDSTLNKNQIQQIFQKSSRSYTPAILTHETGIQVPQQVEGVEDQHPDTYADLDMNLDEILKKDLSASNIHKNGTFQILDAQMKGYSPKLNILKELVVTENYNFEILKAKEWTYCGQVGPDNVLNGVGVLFYKNGKLFEGELRNGKREGSGYELYPDGSFFLGKYLNGKKNGKGRFEWNNGEVYDGEWQDNKKHGSGQWIANNISYVGEWKNNKIEGFGILIEGNERYEGQFVNFNKHGRGTYRYESGEVYTGTFSQNRLNGKGEYYWTNGDYFKGEFINNKRHGQGFLKLSNGIEYRGEFRNDKKCGYGEEVYENEILYMGNFENDLKHGWGCLIKGELPVYTGYWVNNKSIEISESSEQSEDRMAIAEESEEHNDNLLVTDNSQISHRKLPHKNDFSPGHASKPKISRKRQLYQQSKVEKKAKDSNGYNARSRYMRINNNFIQKSIVQQKSSQKSSSSRRRQFLKRSPYAKNRVRQKSHESGCLNKFSRSCECHKKH